MLTNNESKTENVFEEICSRARLEESFATALINKGAAGVDGVTVQAFEANLAKELDSLIEELRSWTYEPQAVRRVEIPKATGGMRNLGIPTVRDRVVQGAIKLVLEPIFEPTFSPSSYGFRPGKGQQAAIAAVEKIVNSGKEYVVDIDLEQFFDRVNHDRLIQRLGQKITDKRVLRLIGMMLRSGVMSNGLIHASTEGTTQGSPLSPLLSNIVLDELDKELEKRKIEFARFADDCNLFLRSPAAAERVMKSIKEFIEKKLKLKVNEKKSKVAKSHLVKFLGMTVLRGSTAIARQSMKRVMAKVKEMIPRGTNQTLERSIERINVWYTGWANYFKMTYYPAQLKAVEAHIRRRLRARFVTQQKKPKYLRKKLVAMGVSSKLANRAAYAGGTWVKSHKRGVEQAYSNLWFKSKGLKTFSDKNLAHWKDIKEWIKLTEEPCT